MLILSFLIRCHFASSQLPYKNLLYLLLISNKLVIKNQASPRRYFLKIHIINIILPSTFLSSYSSVLTILLLCDQCQTDKITVTWVTRLKKKPTNKNNKKKKTPPNPKTCYCFSLSSQISHVYQRILEMSINGPKSSSALLITMEIET